MKKLLTIVTILAMMPVNLNAASTSGEIFFHMNMTDAGTDWDLNRGRINMKGNVGDDTSFRLTLDGKFSDRALMDPYVKYAYVTTKTSMGKLTFGQLKKPWNDVEEKFSGRRWIYKTTPDSEKWMASQDAGMMLGTDWLFNKGMKIYMTSGENGSSPEGEDGVIGLFMQHDISNSMTFSLLSESGSHGTADDDTSIMLGHLAYKAGSFAFGYGFADGEIDDTDATTLATTTTAREGMWFDLAVAMTDGVTLFLKNKDTTDSNETKNMIMGIQTKINDAVHAALTFETDDTDGTETDTTSLAFALKF